MAIVGEPSGHQIGPQTGTTSPGIPQEGDTRVGSDGSIQTFHNGSWSGAPVTTTSTSSGSKKKSGGGGGGGGTAAIDYSSSAVGSTVRDSFIQWFGVSWAASHGATISSAVANHWTADSIMRYAVDSGASSPYINATIAYIRSVCGALPLPTVMNIIASGSWQDHTTFEQFIAPQYQKDSLQNPQSTSFVQDWNDYTSNHTFGSTAQAKLDSIIQQYGYTTQARTIWDQWLGTTDSANTGNYGAAKQDLLYSTFRNIMGRDPTPEELAPGSTYMKAISGDMGSLDGQAIATMIRGSDEYKTTFAAKRPDQTEAQYLSWKDAMNSEGMWFYNDQPNALNPDKAGNIGAPGTGTDTFAGYSNDELKSLNQEGWDPTTLHQYHAALQESIYDKETYQGLLSRTTGASFSDSDWFALANGGQGSGHLRAELNEAQQMDTFRDAYKQMFGTDPTPGDYQRISQEYTSPADLIRENQAVQSAASQLPDVNDLLQRVFGESVTQDELTDMVLQHPGSGALQAKINEATKLDSYRTDYKEYYGHEPTPDDYASLKGYSGAAEFKWDITTQEAMKEQGPTINQAFQDAYGRTLSDDELKSMLGGMEGSGELKAQYQQASKTQQEQQSARSNEFSQQGVDVGYSKAAQGGFQLSDTGLTSYNDRNR